jgi:hypothetical protein
MGLTLRSGSPVAIDYTPSANIAAGDVIAGNSAGIACFVATCAMTNAVAGGSVSIGGGIYEGTMLANYAQGVTVYYDPAADKFTTTSTNNYYFGFVTKTAAANTAGQAYHNPQVSI